MLVCYGTEALGSHPTLERTIRIPDGSSLQYKNHYAERIRISGKNENITFFFNQTTGHKTVITLKEHTKKDLKLKFRNVHALIKKNRPISDITWFSQLYRAKGLDHSKTYDNMTEAWM
jgi:hypothetical protein